MKQLRPRDRRAARRPSDALEVSRQASEGRRAARLSRGLNCFMEGSSTLTSSTSSTQSGSPTDPLKELMSNQKHYPKSDAADKTVVGSPPLKAESTKLHGTGSASIETLETSSSIGGNGQDDMEYSDSKPSDSDREAGGSGGDSYTWIFKRAANLLRESLELGGDGGLIFLDAKGDPDLTADLNILKDSSAAPENPAKTLAMSILDEPFSQPTSSSSPLPATKVDHTFLRKLTRRYPKGRLWSFHSDGSAFTSDDDKVNLTIAYPEGKGSKRMVKNRKQKEARELRKYFPGASQVLFVPLWNAADSSWSSGCFCWNSNERNVFSSALELTSVFGFGTSVMAECSRLDSIISDRQKADFIGSVSHELRSPLHGILAAAEFLTDTQITHVQKSLVDTINSCGRTLLDTISHVLDFSKINSFDRNWNKEDGVKAGTGPGIGGSKFSKTRKGSAAPLLNTFAVTDLAAIAEEVVEGVCVGRSFSDISNYDITDVSDGSSRAGNESRKLMGTGLLGNIEIILDISTDDWVFMTQPGAVRRIVMNLFGNALKYTDKGSILVRIELEGSQNHGDSAYSSEWATLTVADTGKGISEDYLRSRLYTPFSQENVLAPGTGLGLSIVHSIVKMMDGRITVRSRVGEGTVVKVSIPLVRPASIDTSAMPPSLSTSYSGQPELARSLKEGISGTTATIFNFDPRGNIRGPIESTNGILSKYLIDWYGLCLVPWSPDVQADVVLADEKDVPALRNLSTQHFPALIVLCENALTHTRDSANSKVPAEVVEFISKPCGPYKLAGGIRMSLEKVRAMSRSPKAHDDTPVGDVPDSPQTPPEKYSVTMALSSSSMMAEPSGVELMIENTENVQIIEVQRTKDEEDNTVLVPVVEEPTVVAETEQAISTTLPIREPVSPAKKPAIVIPSSPTSTDAEADKAGLKILIVDDNQINLKLLHTFLKRRKPQVLDSAENGKLAVEAVEQNQRGYDIIFMDLSMPIMNGFEATRAIRAFEKEQGLGSRPSTIIALTGLAAGRDVSEAFASGVDLFLTKPVPFKEVSKILDEWQANRTAPPSPAEAAIPT